MVNKKLRKGLIYTLYGNTNFGNKLQNYAVQELLKKYNVDAYTVILADKGISPIVIFKRIVKWLIPKYRYILKIEKDRYHLFERFDKNIQKIKKKNVRFDNYEYIFVGSDQVWNSNDELSLQLVNDVNRIENKKIISIAASIAADNIKEEFLKEYEYHFRKINYISVRENQGKLLIQKLTGRRDIAVLLDPTMLIDVQIWEKLAKKPMHINQLNFGKEKYILTYFLGEINAERKNEIERIALENDCKIINLMDKNDQFYINGPEEFLYLEKNAFLICTDSFHSSVFALLFHRPFVVFEREQAGISNMNSRIETFLTKFNLKNRKYNKTISRENLKCDYTEAQKILDSEKEKFDKYIKNAL